LSLPSNVLARRRLCRDCLESWPGPVLPLGGPRDSTQYQELGILAQTYTPPGLYEGLSCFAIAEPCELLQWEMYASSGGYEVDEE